MRYFIINGLLGQTADYKHGPCFGGDKEDFNRFKLIYEELGLPVPKLGIKRIATYKELGSINKWKYNYSDCKFLIKANNLEAAYMLGLSFKGVAKIFAGLSFGEDFLYESLIELDKIPNCHAGIDELIKSCNPIYQMDKMILSNEMRTGIFVVNSQLEWILKAQEKLLSYKWLNYALNSLSLSHALAGGFMTGSYFECHYSRDRAAESRDMRKKKYYEHKMRYDSAFLSAFKAVEFILQKGNISKSEVPHLLKKYKEKYKISLDELYLACHFKIVGKKSKWQYEDILRYFLKIRNSVAAHGNLCSHIILEDEVFEIQRFSEYLLGQIIAPADNGLKIKI